MRTSRTLLLALFVNFNLLASELLNPHDCPVGNTCVIDVPGMICADGSQSYVTITRRLADSSNLLIHLQGGGACWNSLSCRNGFATNLSRQPPSNDWINGKGIMSSKDDWNPTKDYDVLDVFYCSADVYSGSRRVEYDRKTKLEHRGYENTLRVLDLAKRSYPAPEKVMLYGCSAGGIGAFYHLRNFSKAFPDSERTVITDAGLPLMPPHVPEFFYTKVLSNWGSYDTLPTEVRQSEDPHLGGLMQYNRRHFPETVFGFVASSHDGTMARFSAALGSIFPYRAVSYMVADAAEKYLGLDTPHAKVFYIPGSKHCHGYDDLSGTVATKDVDLASWLSAAIDRSEDFVNLRGDIGVPAPPILPGLQWPRTGVLER